jgi:hypothetical protein
MLYSIGDSHQLRLASSGETEPVSYCNWGQSVFPPHEDFPNPSDCNSYHVSSSRDLKEKIYFSGFKGATGYSSTYTNGGYPCILKTLNKDFTVLPSFGYIDIKAHLPHEKNTEETVSRYVNKTLSFFKGYNVQFVNPIPQFVNPLGSGYPNYEFEERFPYYEEFKYFLKKYVTEEGLKDPISIEDILGVDRLDESFECHDCIMCNHKDFKDIKLDHLKKPFSQKIVNGLLNAMGYDNE